MRRLHLLLLPLLAVPLAVAADEVDLQSRFDHARHRRAFARARIECVACHQVGLPGASDALPGVPSKACHGCHVEDDPSQTRWMRAPTTCGSCHDAVEAPETHGSAWIQWHGTERDATCSDCHSRKDCVDCHDRRSEGDLGVHPPTWLSTHGIEAGAGATCDSCHAQTECLSCHEVRP